MPLPDDPPCAPLGRAPGGGTTATWSPAPSRPSPTGRSHPRCQRPCPLHAAAADSPAAAARHSGRPRPVQLDGSRLAHHEGRRGGVCARRERPGRRRCRASHPCRGDRDGAARRCPPPGAHGSGDRGEHRETAHTPLRRRGVFQRTRRYGGGPAHRPVQRHGEGEALPARAPGAAWPDPEDPLRPRADAPEGADHSRVPCTRCARRSSSPSSDRSKGRADSCAFWCADR